MVHESCYDRLFYKLDKDKALVVPARTIDIACQAVVEILSYESGSAFSYSLSKLFYEWTSWNLVITAGQGLRCVGEEYKGTRRRCVYLRTKK